METLVIEAIFVVVVVVVIVVTCKICHFCLIYWEIFVMTGDFLNRLKASEGANTIVNSIGDVLEHQVRAFNTRK